MKKERSVRVVREPAAPPAGWGQHVAAIIAKLYDQGALLLLGLFIVAAAVSASGKVDPIYAFASATTLGVTFMVYRVVAKVVDGKNVARQIDRDRDVELAKLRDKADRRRVASRSSEPMRRGEVVERRS